MLRTTKIIGGSALAAAAAVGVAVPAYAAATPSAPPASPPGAAHPGHPRARPGLDLLGLTPAVMAKAAGTDTTGLRTGRQSRRSLAQIAARHSVPRATLLSRLDATADAKVATLITTKLLTRPGKGCNPAMPKPGGNRAKGPAGHRRMGGWGRIPGLGQDVKNLASTLKVTPKELRTDLLKGQTLQQIATAHNVSTSTLLAALDKDVNAAIAKAVDRVPPAKKAPATTAPAA